MSHTPHKTILLRIVTVLSVFSLVLLSACTPAARRTAAALALPTRAPEKPASIQMAAEPTKAPEQISRAYPVGKAAGQENQPQATALPQAGGNPQTTSPLAFSPAGSLVIKDAQLDLLVRDTSQALSQVTALVGEHSGYIISSQTWNQDGYLYASVRLGIPSQRFEEALNQLRRIGLSVLKENAQGQDVTDQFVDLQSRLTNLEATAARVREFLKDAKTIEESLRINAQLSELEAQIEQVKGSMRYIEGRVAYSTVTVSLTPQYPTPTPTVTPTSLPTATPTPAWNPGVTFDKASGVLSKQFQGFVDAVIWIGLVIAPWAVLLALAYLALRALLRKSMPKGR